MNNNPSLVEWQSFSMDLIEEGWKTPQTYSSHFSEIENISAVYMFVLVEREFYKNAILAYVGMSKRLRQRISGHPIKGEIATPGMWLMTWFKPVPLCDLRRVETDCIRKYDPKWNLVGRRRGVVLS